MLPVLELSRLVPTASARGKPCRALGLRAQGCVASGSSLCISSKRLPLTRLPPVMGLPWLGHGEALRAPWLSWRLDKSPPPPQSQGAAGFGFGFQAPWWSSHCPGQGGKPGEHSSPEGKWEENKKKKEVKKCWFFYLDL